MKTKTILITGCSSGIGKATVEYAAARGHTVLASAPRKDLLADIPDQAAAKYIIDVCVEDSIRTAIEAATAQFGAIDVLINNAGYCQAGPVELVSADKIERQFQVNVFGPLALIRHVAPLMRANGGACIINLSSMLGLLGMPIMGIYSASKHAVEGKAIDVARVITKALESRSPRARYKVTGLGKLLPLLVRCLPVRLTDRMLTKAIW